MRTELNFEAMPFEAYEALDSQQSGFELEEEFGRRARSRLRRQGFAPRAPRVMPKRPGPPPVFRPGKPKKPPVYPPRFPPFPPGGSRGCGRRALWWCARPFWWCPRWRTGALWRRARALSRRTAGGRLGVHALGAKCAERCAWVAAAGKRNRGSGDAERHSQLSAT
jgi:hypothetical protein